MQDKAKGVDHMLEDAGALPQCQVIHLLHRSHPCSGWQFRVWVKPELVGLPGKALARDAMRRLQFVVHAAVWQHSMVLCKREIPMFEIWLYPLHVRVARFSSTQQQSDLCQLSNLIFKVHLPFSSQPSFFINLPFPCLLWYPFLPLTSNLMI